MSRANEIDHCVRKIADLVACGESDRRSILQVGYNLGRLSELTGEGREPFWDAWKSPVERWDQLELSRLARQLERQFLAGDDGSTTGRG